MRYREVEESRAFVARLTHGADWRAQIERFAREEGVEAAFFVGLGAVEDAELYFYDQDQQRYVAEPFEEPLEVAACIGNISLLDGEPFAHTHVTLSREDGSTVAGHLNEARTFAGELYCREFASPLDREPDGPTGLDLWGL